MLKLILFLFEPPLYITITENVIIIFIFMI